MKIKDESFFITIRGFLTVYLPKQKCVSHNTIKSYRETLNLLLTYLQEARGIHLSKVSFADFDYRTVIAFLDWLQNVRKCSISTRNQRLMVLKSFFKYAGIVDNAQISLQMELNKVPVKKQPYTVVDFLTEDWLKILLSQPNIKTRLGLRNQFFMILMYDTAARCQEMLDLKLGDFESASQNPYVYLTGKGNKMRSIPIMKKTIEHLNYYLDMFHPLQTRNRDSYLFYTTIHGERKQMSPDNVASFMKQYGESARKLAPEIPSRVHPHQLRHTRAIHLYRGGMPLPILSEFLGHSDPSTSQIYAYADTEMKRAAIQKAIGDKTPELDEKPIWKDDEEMLKKLYGLI